MSTNRKQIRLAGELGCFVQKRYARKARNIYKPNDRRHVRRTEKTLRKLRPEELSDLLSGDCEPETTD
ncbi:hypothetical protein [Paraburkholderia sp. J76]|uniref:hypothetical protein n=1 Tax=Paraburkholderia sp. J76 TaxID=2805439 RepID=UPI002ABE6669|nr:hypothetical protein [Paraburkholderia sp. J76]